MSSPLVSIIMPVYNGEAFLQKAIDSILAQSYSNWELIVMNDGSTDSSRDIVLQNKDGRIRLIDNERNLGIIETKNRAADLSRGKYITTLDADDIAAPTRLEKQVAYLEQHPECGLCATLHQEIDQNDTPGALSNFPTAPRDVHTYLLIANCICHSSTMLRADLMRELKYDSGYPVAEDYELWDRISSTHSIVNLPEVLTYYRIHGNNISVVKKEKMFETVKKLAARILRSHGLHFSDRELKLHSDLISYSNKLLNTGADLREIQQWVRRFYLHFADKKEWDADTLYKMLADRFIVACVHRKRYSALLWNRVAGLRPGLYLSILAGKMRGKAVNFNQSSSNP